MEVFKVKTYEIKEMQEEEAMELLKQNDKSIRSRILEQWKIGRYTVPELDNDPPMKPYRKYRIDGIIYDPVPVYDLPRSIAIEDNGKFKGKMVEFI